MTCTKTAIMTLFPLSQKHTVTPCQEHPVLNQTVDYDDQSTEVNSAIHTLVYTVRQYAEMRLCKSAYRCPPDVSFSAARRCSSSLHLTLCFNHYRNLLQ